MYIYCVLYSRKVWQVESLANLTNRLRFAKLKPCKLVITITNPLANLFIYQTFFCQMLETNKSAKHSPCKTFPLYSNSLSFCLILYSPKIVIRGFTCDKLLWVEIWAIVYVRSYALSITHYVTISRLFKVWFIHLWDHL